MAGYCSGSLVMATCLVVGETKSRPVLPFFPPRERELWLSLITCCLPSPAVVQAIQLKLFFAVAFVLPYPKAVSSKVDDLHSGMQVLFTVPAVLPLLLVISCDHQQSVKSPQHTDYLALLHWAW